MRIEIEFDHLNGKYTTGEVVSGTVIIKSSAPTEVTGLTVHMNLFYKYNFRDSFGKQVPVRRKVPMHTLNLNNALFGGSKNKSKVLPIGLHQFPFTFPNIPIAYPPSFTGNSTSCRYTIVTDLGIKYKETEKNETRFTVTPVSLDDNPNAIGWQTKSSSKFFKLSFKKVSVEVTIPTGISRTESVPIHLFISNSSNNPTKIIRSRLICCLVRKDLSTDEKSVIVNENVEEITTTDRAVTHYLKIMSSGTSFSCQLIEEKYIIQLEVEASGKLMIFEFPVIVGEWKGRPARRVSPLELMDDNSLNEGQEEPEIYNTTSKIVDFNAPREDVAPQKVPIPGAPTTPPVVPSAIPPPPSYERAVQAPPRPSESSHLTMSEFFYTATALYSFKAVHPSELSFEIGQIITNVHESNEDGWLVGTINGKTGLIPGRYVEPVASGGSVARPRKAPPLPTMSVSHTKSEFFYTAKAMYSFKAAHPSELSFEIGQLITNVHESNEEGWVVGTTNGRTGLIPGGYVEPISESGSQTRSKKAPPVPTTSVSHTTSRVFYTAKALYSFKAIHPSELSFEIGQLITNVHESNEAGWVVGTIDERTGLIPGGYVEPVADVKL